jgi:hydrogenase maturation protease
MEIYRERRKMMEKILVLGVGNLLLGDEGLGVQAVRYLETAGLPPYIDLLDGGTGGFHLLSLMDEYKKMIIIDAALDDSQVGTLKVVYPKFSNDFPRALTTHDIGLKDLIDTAAVLNISPEIILIAVTICPHQDLGMKLTPDIEKMLPAIASRVLELSARMHQNLAPLDPVCVV